VGDEIFRTPPDRPWGPPSFLYNGYQVSLAEVKPPGGGVDHPTPSSADVKETVELYLYLYISLYFLILAKHSQFIPLQNVVYFITLLFLFHKIFIFYINDVLLFNVNFQGQRVKGNLCSHVCKHTTSED